MEAITLAELPALPGAAQVELAVALWQSLASSQLERRWARHRQHPKEAVSWAQWGA